MSSLIGRDGTYRSARIPTRSLVNQVADTSVAVRSQQRARDWCDALIASDPGLLRLARALSVAAGIGVTIAVEYGFAQLAHPLWDSAPAGAPLNAKAVLALAAQHHAVTLVTMMLGGIIGMVGNFAMSDVTRRQQAITLTGMPVVFLSTLSISLELAPHRAVGFVGLTLAIGFGTYIRKFTPQLGPRVVMYGLLLFVGYFFGFIAGKLIPIGQIYWPAAILWLAVLVNLGLRLVVFDRVAPGTLSRSRRAFAARARGVIAAAAATLESPEDGAPAEPVNTRRLARRLVRLNEAAIIIDAQLGDPRYGLRPSEGRALHDDLFELELSLDNLGRAITALAETGAQLDPRSRAQVQGWLEGLAHGDTSDAAGYGQATVSEAAVLTILATDNIVFATAALVVAVGESLGRWQRSEPQPAPVKDQLDIMPPYKSPVMLIGDALAGSIPAGNAAFVADTSAGRASRLHLDAPAVAAIRIMIAVGAACAIGNAVNERRFYWAVIAVFMIYFGTNTAGEQITKSVERVLGTCIGIVLGSLLAHAIGPSTWSIAVILPALALGVYFMSVSYVLLMIGFTVMVSMLYVDLGEFSNGLLLDRLELTAIGAVIAALAGLLIFPVRTRPAVGQAMLRYLDALLDLVVALSEAVRSAPQEKLQTAASQSTTAARHLDDTLQQLLVTTRPLTHNPLHRDEPDHNFQVFVVNAHFARNLAADVGAVNTLDSAERAQLAAALNAEADLVRDLHETISQHELGSHTQAVSPAIDPIIETARRLAGQGVVRSDPRRRFLRALSNLDGTLIQLRRQLTDA
jgi:uncharacterized membrane protein YgaE (UPF0421/DUF939 family)